MASILPKLKHAKKIEKELHINCLLVVGECGWFSVCPSILFRHYRFHQLQCPSFARIHLLKSQDGSPSKVVGIGHRFAQEKSLIPKEAAVGFSKFITHLFFWLREVNYQAQTLPCAVLAVIYSTHSLGYSDWKLVD